MKYISLGLSILNCILAITLAVRVIKKKCDETTSCEA